LRSIVIDQIRRGWVFSSAWTNGDATGADFIIIVFLLLVAILAGIGRVRCVRCVGALVEKSAATATGGVIESGAVALVPALKDHEAAGGDDSELDGREEVQLKREVGLGVAKDGAGDGEAKSVVVGLGGEHSEDGAAAEDLGERSRTWVQAKAREETASLVRTTPLKKPQAMSEAVMVASTFTTCAGRAIVVANEPSSCFVLLEASPPFFSAKPSRTRALVRPTAPSSGKSDSTSPPPSAFSSIPTPSALSCGLSSTTAVPTMYRGFGVRHRCPQPCCCRHVLLPLLMLPT
jgi:hypothetical protein